MNDIVRKIKGLPYKNIYVYWQHYWEYCIDALTDKDNLSFKIVGPRMLLVDLVDELEGHGMSNQDNMAFFRTRLFDLEKSDEAFHRLCHPIVVNLFKMMSNKENVDSCIILCKKAINALVEKHYFSMLVDWLAKIMDETTNSDFESRKKINEVTHFIIAEYVVSGFTLNEIRKYATDIPEVAIAQDGIIIAAPSEYEALKESDFSSKDDYYKAIDDYLKKRDVYKCLEVLKYRYYESPRKAHLLVRLNGLKGTIDDYIGDINIYSPRVKRYVTGKFSLTEIESISPGRDYVNAAIPIDFIIIEQAKECGKIKLEVVLDLLMLTYRTKVPVTVATNMYSVVVDGNEIGMSMSARGNDPTMASRDEMMRYLDALDLTDVNEKGFKYISDKHKILEENRSSINIRLKNAAHWYSKAISAEKDVDILLYSWFAIEGLLKVSSRIQSEVLDNNKDVRMLKIIQGFVSSIICKHYFHDYLREIYGSFIFMTNQHNYYDLSDEAIRKAGLNLKAGNHYRDGDFLNAVPELIACVNDDIVRDKLIQVRKFYQDVNGIKDKENLIREDLLMIYRLRNMVVHNAAISCVNISFYAREARFFALRVIWYIIDNLGREKSIDEIVLSAKLDYQVFLTNFDEELKLLKGGI